MAESTFVDFVKTTREKKKAEALAQEMLGRGRKSNAPGSGAISSTRNGAQKPSLASRIGVNKQRSVSAKPSIDGKWQHDLHKLNNPSGRGKALHRTVSTSQIERNTRTFNKFQSNLQNNGQSNAANSGGFSIRGVASGSYTLVASNFAPGTTAADIQSVFAPIGGEVLSCKLISKSPTVMVEIVFTDKEGAENVVATFNNSKADGRLLYVYIKDTPTASATVNNRSAVSAPQTSLDDMDIDNADASLQDGRFGFGETPGNNPPRGPRRDRERQSLYSDNFATHRKRY